MNDFLIFHCELSFIPILSFVINSFVEIEIEFNEILLQID